MIHYILFIAILVNVNPKVQGLDNINNCNSTRCASNGPVIRFPFRIEGKQPKHCGYPQRWFVLSCSQTNETLLHLSSSWNLSVKHINYTSQLISAYSSEYCLPKRLLNFNISTSPFFFYSDDDYYSDYTLFSNCSGNWRLPRPISCLSNSQFEVYGFLSDDLESFSYIAEACFKMKDIPSVLSPYFSEKPNGLQLKWKDPDCTSCESKGGHCRLQTNTTDSVIDCSGIPRLDEGENCGLQNNTQESQAECSGSPRSGWPITKFLAAGITLGSILLLGAAYLLLRFYRYNKMEREYQSKIQRFLDDYKSLKPTRFSYSHLKRMTNGFKDQLGKGAYGTVYKGKLSLEILAAVKLLDNTKGNGEEFVNEVGTIGRIHHVNVVRLIGFCADGFTQALVYEYLPNDSLQKYISSTYTKIHFLGWKRLQSIALGIAKGIDYLHQGCDQRILHFDIKPQNILLDHDFNPKVSDFGLAKLCDKDQSVVSMTTAKGTIGYMAPEIFSRNFGSVSYKSDVYSFGMLVLEMVGGRRIMEETNGNDEQIYFPEWIYNLLEEGEDLRLEIEEEEDAKIAKKLAIVGLWCIQWNPMDRPSMKFVVKRLEDDGESLTVPPNPFRSAASASAREKLPRRLLQLDMDVIHEIE